MQQIRVIDTGLIKVVVSLHFCPIANHMNIKLEIMTYHYHRSIEQCINNYREALLARAQDPDNEDYEIWESCAYNNLEEAIEDKVRVRMLASISSWLRSELPF